jgi:hypothetical protein
MKRIYVLSAVLMCVIFFAQLAFAAPPDSLAVAADSSYWQKAIIGNLNLTQNKFDNWVAGGDDAFAWLVNLNMDYTYKKDQVEWVNKGRLAYGQTKVNDNASRKSLDEIKLSSVFNYRIAFPLDPYVSFSFESQLTPSYTYDPKVKISDFMDPGYFIESAGVGRMVLPILETRIGLAAKQTVADEFAPTYSDDSETSKIETVRNEIGAEAAADLKWKINEQSTLNSNLHLFSNFSATNEIDVNWNTVLATSISKYFNFNFNFKVFYDRDISVKRQLHQSIAMGVTYNFL